MVDILVGSSAEMYKGWMLFYPSLFICSLFPYFCGMSSAFFSPLLNKKTKQKRSARRTGTVTSHNQVSAAPVANNVLF